MSSGLHDIKVFELMRLKHSRVSADGSSPANSSEAEIRVVQDRTRSSLAKETEGSLAAYSRDWR